MDTTFSDDTPLLVAAGAISKPKVLRTIFLAKVVGDFFWPRQFPFSVHHELAPDAVASMTMPTQEEIGYVNNGDYFQDKTGYDPNIFANFLQTAELPADPDHMRALETFVDADRGWLEDLCELVGKMDAEFRACAYGKRILQVPMTAAKVCLIFIPGKDIWEGKIIASEMEEELGLKPDRLWQLSQSGCFDITQREARILWPKDAKEFNEIGAANLICAKIIHGVLDFSCMWPFNKHVDPIRTKKYDLTYTRDRRIAAITEKYSGHRIPEKLQQIEYPLGSWNSTEAASAELVNPRPRTLAEAEQQTQRRDDGQSGLHPL